MLLIPTKAHIEDDSDVQSILDVLNGFVKGWNLHDVKMFSSVFADDADFTNVKGVAREGRVAIEALHEPLFKTIWVDSTLTITKTKTRFLKPDVASVDAWWILEGLKNAEGGDQAPRNGLLSFVMMKHDHKWLITVMHNMDLPGSSWQNC